MVKKNYNNYLKLNLEDYLIKKELRLRKRKKLRVAKELQSNLVHIILGLRDYIPKQFLGINSNSTRERKQRISN